MNRFAISICALLLATACGLTAAEMVGKNATTDRIAEDLVFGSGRTLTIESGATLLIAAGATANFSLATVTLPTQSPMPFGGGSVRDCRFGSA